MPYGWQKYTAMNGNRGLSKINAEGAILTWKMEDVIVKIPCSLRPKEALLYAKVHLHLY